jgi:toxin ParE1/3/4
MRVRWSGAANRDAISIEHFLRDRSLQAARAMFARIQSRTAELSSHPLMGRPGRADDTRELVITGTPYIAIYRVFAEEVVIMRLIHGAQRWPPADEN